MKSLRPDWQRIALEIRKRRPLEQVSKDLGWHKDKLNQIARGDQKRLAFDEGIALLDMAYDLIGHERLVVVANEWKRQQTGCMSHYTKKE